MTKEPGTEKKAWQKPGLIVLARSNPEEMVLAACKTPTQAGSPLRSRKTCSTAGCQITLGS